MDNLFAERMDSVPRSFIREILKVAVDPEIISFAGGLPNKDLFPVKALQAAANEQFETAGKEILQYSTTEGYQPLREYLAERYRKKRGIEVSADEILITHGSQQALDLLSKIFINKGDNVVVEEPGYLGAIQAFSVYSPQFRTVPLDNEGMNKKVLSEVIDKYDPPFIYTVPNFQNPSGISYSEKNKREIAEVIRESNSFLIEDDPYGELRYVGEDISSFKSLTPEQTILLGSFSKIVAPAFRIGWVVAPCEVMEKLIVAKQAADLHSNYIGQRIIYQFLQSNELDEHIEKIRNCYGRQREVMLESINKYFPEDVKCTKPEGGMFLWAELPEGLSAMKLFEKAVEEKVAFVPGAPFYIGKEDTNTLRLNYSCVSGDKIEEGIKRLGTVIKEML